MQSSTSEPAVRHNPTASRFEITVDGKRCVADYERDGARIIFTHTFVPDELRGRGLAQKLVQTALEYARSENLRILPVCSFVRVYLKRLNASGRRSAIDDFSDLVDDR